MRVHYLATTELPARNASAVHVMNMAHGLHSVGASVTMTAFRGDLSLAGPQATWDDLWAFYGLPRCFEIDWLQRPKQIGRSTLLGLAAALRARRQRPDLVLGRYPRACAMACYLGIPTVFETHKPLTAFQPIERLLLKRMLRAKNFRGMVTISQPLHKTLVEETGLPDERVLVAHDAATPLKGVAAQIMGPPERLQAGYLGSLNEGRGIDLIIDLARLSEDIDVHIIGGTAAEIERWQTSVRIPRNVVFHGFRTPAEAARMRLGMDVLLAPYQEDTRVGGLITAQWMSPIKVFEYMASHKPILCSDLPVLREVLRNEENALLLPPREPRAWAAALTRLKSDTALADRLALAALRDFQEHYTWQGRARRILQFAANGRRQ